MTGASSDAAGVAGFEVWAAAGFGVDDPLCDATSATANNETTTNSDAPMLTRLITNPSRFSNVEAGLHPPWSPWQPGPGTAAAGAEAPAYKPRRGPELPPGTTPILGQCGAIAQSPQRGCRGRQTFCPQVTRYRSVSYTHLTLPTSDLV